MGSAKGSNTLHAESCTGGTIASRITAHAGHRNFWSAVTYAPSAKAHFFGVTPEVIDEHGVVSAAVAVQWH